MLLLFLSESVNFTNRLIHSIHGDFVFKHYSWHCVGGCFWIRVDQIKVTLIQLLGLNVMRPEIRIGKTGKLFG